MILKDFELTRIKDFDLTKIMRFQYILENFLQYEVDESSMQRYIAFLMRNHHILIANIVSYKSNIELILKNLYTENFTYIELLSEIFETVRSDSVLLKKVQIHLNSLMFINYIIGIFESFENIEYNEDLRLKSNNIYYNKVENICRLFQIMIDYFNKNPDNVLKKLFSFNKKFNNKILEVFLHMYFKYNQYSSSSLILSLLSMIFRNREDNDHEYAMYKDFLLRTVVGFILNFNIKFSFKLLKLIEMLTFVLTPIEIVSIIEKLRISEKLVDNINLKRHKKLTALILKVLIFIYKAGLRFFSTNIEALLIRRVSYLDVNKKNSMLANRLYCLINYKSISNMQLETKKVSKGT